MESAEHSFNPNTFGCWLIVKEILESKYVPKGWEMMGWDIHHAPFAIKAMKKGKLKTFPLTDEEMSVMLPLHNAMKTFHNTVVNHNDEPSNPEK
jgi:hypothetical protein